jgi:hypothetical protein
LIENKVSFEYNYAEKLHIDNRNFDSITILMNGILRCNKSLSIIYDLIISSNGKIRLVLAGPTAQLNPNILNLIISTGNVKIINQYDDNTISNLYQDVDLVWGSDLNDCLNAKLLLPYRLYQAVSQSTPILGFGESFLSRTIQQKKLGLILSDSNCISSNDVDIIFMFLKNFDYSIFNHYKIKAFRKDEWNLLIKKELPEIPLEEDFSIILG